MNTYSRALKHISMKDVKKKHQQKLIEQKIQIKLEREEKTYIQSVMVERRVDWRKELSEQMTTTDVFFTNLPSTGNVNLAYSNWDIGGGQQYSVSGNSVTISGDPTVQNGFVANFNISVYDTIVFDVSGSNILLGVFNGGTKVITSPGTYALTVSPKSVENIIFTLAPGSGNTTISNPRYQRRTPISVFVPLDSPEAVSFIRTGSGDLSPEEKQKRVKEMLQASDKYVRQMYGNDFPGTGATSPGEAGDTPGVEISQIQPAQQQKGTTGVGVPDTKELPGPRPAMPGKMNYPPEWTQWKNA